mgnify:CR=1 FL=1
MISLKDKNIVVTGASSGIGKAISILCSNLGAKVLLIGRNEKNLVSVKNACAVNDHLVLVADITNHDLLEVDLRKALKYFGKVDGFVHSAGVEMTRPLKMLKTKQLDEAMQVNLYACINIARILTGRGVFNDGGGSMVFISSIAGVCGQSGKIGYGASKGALLAAGKSLALELSPKRIRVNSILPAMVKTQMSMSLINSLPLESKSKIESMHPLGLGEPEDIANGVVFLLSDLTKWTTGTSMIIDGGYSAS